MRTLTGLQRLAQTKSIQESIKGNVALLCHAASITHEFRFAPDVIKEIYGDRFVKLFGPQHGFVTDVQDNMIETNDYIHPYYKVPVHSLYGEVRWPTEKMLEGIDTFIIDLQDVGTRVYTYVWTLSYILEKCATANIEVVVLDRPNPVNGVQLEGTILDKNFSSFVGRDELLHRHGLTMGEFGHWYLKHKNLQIKYRVIEMENWQREMYFHETNLPWVNPSPNLPCPESAYNFVATVMLEGTNLSEGRGTTRPLEFIGHPDIEPYQFLEKIKKCPDYVLATKGICLRPTVTFPMFQKHAQKPNGGLFFHITDLKTAQLWRCGQFLIREFKNELGNKFAWKTDSYEYEDDKKAIDLINGDETTSKWAEDNGPLQTLIDQEAKDIKKWRDVIAPILIY